MYTYFVLDHTETYLRHELFYRMEKEKLLGAAMHAFVAPTLQDWCHLIDAEKTVLLCAAQTCDMHKDTHTVCDVHAVQGMALLQYWRGQVWTFDFVVFRDHFKDAVPMGQGALAWAFAHLPCQSIVGFCANSNRHAWRLAERTGFSVLGRVPGACYTARRQEYEDGVFVMACAPDKFI